MTRAEAIAHVLSSAALVIAAWGGEDDETKLATEALEALGVTTEEIEEAGL